MVLLDGRGGLLLGGLGTLSLLEGSNESVSVIWLESPLLALGGSDDDFRVDLLQSNEELLVVSFGVLAGDALPDLKSGRSIFVSQSKDSVFNHIVVA